MTDPQDPPRTAPHLPVQIPAPRPLWRAMLAPTLDGILPGERALAAMLDRLEAPR